MIVLIFGLIGNFNFGKIILFNQFIGLCQWVGNWVGVIVECKEGVFYIVCYVVCLVDLFGIYLLISVFVQVLLDEQIVCCYIVSGEVDVLVNVVDVVNLECNLYFMVQLWEMGIFCIVVLNMFDIVCSQCICIDIDGLVWCFGCLVVLLVFICVDGIDELKVVIDFLQFLQVVLVVDYLLVIQVQVGYFLEMCVLVVLVIELCWLVLQVLEGDIFNGLVLGLLFVILEQVCQGCGEEFELVIVDVCY